MKDILARLINGLKVTFLGGISLLWLAPIIPLISIVPEFAQHVAEIQLGMFDSKEAFSAKAMSEERWFFAYFKIAGLLIAILAAARFLGGAGKRWWDPRTVDWKRFLFALALNIAAGVIGFLIAGSVESGVPDVVNMAFQIATLPLLIYLVGPLYGDKSMTLKRAYTVGWFSAAMAGFFSLAAWLPAQPLHEYNHTLAMGQGDLVVWALMIWDSVLVGLMACWLGAGLAAGYWLGRPPEPGTLSEKA
ncbi:hypothetical protein [Qipengyuania gelatinilytica]|uniref:Uncharacterized protein n=1 Tax=Qipengyuania gelatinilytica TaxID=2867231 RepID=A0ABX8ZZQ0_9SPHN|nr:hypothetical protein [Qipengyuania gelatinilytica]QZD94465.1 hypothetical protein K3136_10205 [Qipengyuania gelatinilytica]